MVNANLRVCVLVLVAALVTGCGGGGGASTALPASPSSGPAPTGSSIVKATIVVAASATPAPAAIRKPKFVSPSTAGVSIVVYAQSDTNHTTILGQSATNISPGSSACTAGPPRTCTASVVAPYGADDFVITTYDQPPNGSSFAGAHVLGTSNAMQTIVSGQSNSIAVYVQGSIASVNATPAFASLPADGGAHSLAIVVAPADYDDNPISAGANDPYANPITVSLVETGGSGHTSIVFDGANSGTSATLTKSSDTIALQYDGGGSPGYTATATFSATGVTSQTVQLSPLYITGSTPYFTAGTIAFTAAAQTSAVTLSESGFTGSYTATPANCTGIVTVAVAASIATFTAGTSAASPGICTVALSDGMSSITVSVGTTVTTSTVTVLSGGGTMTEYTGLTGSSWWIAPGPDGNMWFTEVGNDKVGKITPAGLIQEYNGQSSEPFEIAAGGDGNMWYTLLSGNAVGRITTSGTVTVFSGPQLPWGIAQGADGNIWFGTQSSCCPTPASIGFVTPGGSLNYWPLTGAGFQELTLGPDGNIWFTDDDNNAVGNLTTGGVFTEHVIPTASSNPFGIAAGADGNIWFCENATNKIGKFTLSNSTFAEYVIPTAGAGCYGMAAGPDGNVWFAESTGNNIAKISTAGAITEYPVPTAGAQPTQVAPGANGTIWFTEQGTLKIGVLQY